MRAIGAMSSKPRVLLCIGANGWPTGSAQTGCSTDTWGYASLQSLRHEISGDGLFRPAVWRLVLEPVSRIKPTLIVTAIKTPRSTACKHDSINWNDR